jgi:hypothetical protein
MMRSESRVRLIVAAGLATTIVSLATPSISQNIRTAKSIRTEMALLRNFCENRAAPDEPRCTTENYNAKMTELENLLRSTQPPVPNVVQPNNIGVYFLNCSGSGVSVKTYNLNDDVLLIPYQERNISYGEVASLKCATYACKMKIGNAAASKAMAGYVNYKNGSFLYWYKSELSPGKGQSGLCN